LFIIINRKARKVLRKVRKVSIYYYFNLNRCIFPVSVLGKVSVK
jgi:hypothetical protein